MKRDGNSAFGILSDFVLCASHLEVPDLYLFFFFPGQDFVVSRQALYHLGHSTSPVLAILTYTFLMQSLQEICEAITNVFHIISKETD